MDPRTLLHAALARLNVTLAPVRSNRLMWLEVVVISLGAIAVGMFFQRDNPFQVGSEFHWIWLAPVLIALRYGVVPGVVSSLILIAAWKLILLLGGQQENFPEQFFLGGLILTMICGEFSAAWSSRLRRAEETNRYLDERLARITSRHLLLRLSHDRMEQEILTKPVTLRDALNGVRQLTAEQTKDRMPASGRLLQMLTQYCQLESAAIFIPGKDGCYERASQIGSPPDLSAEDPLLQHAIENRSLAHLQLKGLGDNELPSPFLVVVPILNSEQVSLGVLAIDRMPFLAVNEENLQMLSVMLGYYANCVSEAEGVRIIRDTFPSAPMDFAAELHKLLMLQRGYGINSHIVALPFGNDEAGRQAIAQITRIRRGLDISWLLPVGDRTLLINLMPLATEASVEGYLIRIETILMEYMGDGYDQWRLAPQRISFAEADPVVSLQRIIAERHD
ncbi:MAG: PelD GGDEF domain-containing protein [Sideroxyarcus sp.]|nr:PelD GGDEF domain-containing protein [Sideroxyarcus sp.]